LLDITVLAHKTLLVDAVGYQTHGSVVCVVCGVQTHTPRLSWREGAVLKSKQQLELGV